MLRSVNSLFLPHSPGSSESCQRRLCITWSSLHLSTAPLMVGVLLSPVGGRHAHTCAPQTHTCIHVPQTCSQACVHHKPEAEDGSDCRSHGLGELQLLHFSPIGCAGLRSTRGHTAVGTACVRTPALNAALCVPRELPGCALGMTAGHSGELVHLLCVTCISQVVFFFKTSEIIPNVVN